MRPSPSVLSIAVSSLVVVAAEGQSGPAQVAATGPSVASTQPASPIRYEEGVLRFPDGKTIAITSQTDTTQDVGDPDLEGWRSAAVSRDGQLAAVLDLKTKSITVLDSKANELRTLVITKRFAAVHVSDRGMVVATGYVPVHMMEHSYNQVVAVYESKGKQLKLFDRVRPGAVHVISIKDGSAVAVVMPPGILEVFTDDGGTAQRDLRPKSGDYEHYSIGAVAADPQGRRAVISALAVGALGAPARTYVLVYDATGDPWRWNSTEWVQEGVYFQPGSMAVSPDATQCYAIEPQLLRCFDLVKNRQEWVDVIGNPDLGTIKPTRTQAIYVGQERVVTAHLVPTGPGWRVLYSVFNRDRTPVHLFATQSIPPAASNSFLSEEIKGTVPPVWAVSEDGQSLETLIKPQTRIPLVSKR